MDDAEAVEALGRAGCVTAEQLVLRPEAKHTGLAPVHRFFVGFYVSHKKILWKNGCSRLLCVSQKGKACVVFSQR